MPNQFTSNTFLNTYKDDYRDSDNYHRILFNSGKALQAREITQLQTIIQSEIARFGRNIFKEGAAVNPGGLIVDNNYEFIKLDTTVNGLPPNPADLIGVTLTSDPLGIVVTVLEAINDEGDDPAVLYVRYTNTTGGASGEDPIRVPAGSELTGSVGTFTVQDEDTVDNPATGKGTKLHIHKGDFFTQGHFVFAPNQSLILSKFTTNPNVDVGFKVFEDIVTVNDTTALYDNQGVTPNLSSPGADRYRIRLVATTRDLVDSDENFIFLAKVQEGVILDEVKGTTDAYAKINDVLALRTKEESGNYIARNFTLKYSDNVDDPNKLNFEISPGVAYVNGYRAAREALTTIPVLKPRTSEISNNQIVAAQYGNYVYVSGSNGLPNINEFQQVNLRDSANYGGITIGTARVRAIEEDGGDYKVYFFQVVMNAGQNQRSVRSFGTSASDYMDLVLELGQAKFYDTSNNSLLFPLSQSRPKSLSDMSLTVQRRFSTTADGNGDATITLSTSGETFADPTLWIAADSDVFQPTFTGSVAGQTTATINNAPPNQAFEVLTYVNKSAGTVRAKTLVTEFTEALTGGAIDLSGNVTLTKADIYEVLEIRDTNSGGADISANYTIDNGQRDNYYGFGKLNKVAGATTPTTVWVKYNYFTHGASGNFFAVNSYSGQINYEDIPDYTLSNGTVVNLRDVIDFRPVVNSSGTFASGAIINELPRNTDTILTDVEYYKSKAVSVAIDETGKIYAQESPDAFNPSIPDVPNNSLQLFQVGMPAYTLSANDVNTRIIQAKRYTMADIGKIEKRLNELAEVTSLSLLELKTETFNVLDSDGNIRSKSGFYVDNFKDHLRSLTNYSEYRAAIDPQLGHLRPQFDEDHISLRYDAGSSSGVTKKGDNLYLNYTNKTYINQALVSGTENINPFAVITNRGFLELSPSSDEWRTVEYISDRVVDGGVNFIPNNEALWNNWEWNWAGQPIQEGSTLTQNRTVTGRGTEVITTTVSATIASEDVVRNVVDDRIVSTTFIPFIRSKKVYFRALGMQPNTKLFAFFDNTPVNNWVRAEPYQLVSDQDSDYGNEFKNAVEHPNTPSVLTTNGEGKVEGSFFIPSTSNLKFRTGQKEFKLLDISKPNDDDALTIASTSYIAQGILEKRQQTFTSTRNVRVNVTESTTTTGGDTGGTTTGGGGGRRRKRLDPLAQSFFVDQQAGIFVTRVGIKFATKSNTDPVCLQLRPVVNGVPAADEIVPGGIKFLSATSVDTSVDGTSITYFEFDEPIYLNGETEYAIVLMADTTDYTVYIAETYAFQLGSTEKRISRQPAMGSLFLSQNGSTWTPDQTKDLAFKIDIADFTASSGTVILHNATTPYKQLINAPLTTTNASATVRVYDPSHGFLVGDAVNIKGAIAVGGITAANINGDRTILAVDGTGWTFTAGGIASSSTIGGGANVKVTKNIMFDLVYPVIENILPPATLITVDGKFTTGQSLAGTEVAYTKDTNYSVLFNKENNVFNTPKLVATRANEVANILGAAKSVDIRINLSSGSSYVSPVIDLQRCSMGLIHNRIDNQDSDATSGFNAPLTFVNETHPRNGTHLAKHITNVITLAQQATGIKILLAANRPAAASFDVYYRTNAEVENIFDESWVLLPSESNIPSDENPNVFREYRYLAGGDTGTLLAYDELQIKIVFRSTNSAKVPVIQDLRVIALAAI